MIQSGDHHDKLICEKMIITELYSTTEKDTSTGECMSGEKEVKDNEEQSEVQTQRESLCTVCKLQISWKK